MIRIKFKRYFNCYYPYLSKKRNWQITFYPVFILSKDSWCECDEYGILLLFLFWQFELDINAYKRKEGEK